MDQQPRRSARQSVTSAVRGDDGAGHPPSVAAPSYGVDSSLRTTQNGAMAHANGVHNHAVPPNRQAPLSSFQAQPVLARPLNPDPALPTPPAALQYANLYYPQSQPQAYTPYQPYGQPLPPQPPVYSLPQPPSSQTGNHGQSASPVLGYGGLAQPPHQQPPNMQPLAQRRPMPGQQPSFALPTPPHLQQQYHQQQQQQAYGNGPVAPFGHAGPSNAPPQQPHYGQPQPFFNQAHLFNTNLPIAQVAPKLDYRPPVVPAQHPNGQQQKKRNRSPSPPPQVNGLPPYPPHLMATATAEEAEIILAAQRANGMQNPLAAVAAAAAQMSGKAGITKAKGKGKGKAKGKQRATPAVQHPFDAVVPGAEDDDDIPPPLPLPPSTSALPLPPAGFGALPGAAGGNNSDEDADGEIDYEAAVKPEMDDEFATFDGMNGGIGGLSAMAAYQGFDGLGALLSAAEGLEGPKKKKPKTGKGKGKGRARPKAKSKAKAKPKKEESEQPKAKKVEPPPSRPGYILQPLTCANKSASNPLAPILGMVPKCHECTTRRTGYSCLFRGIRSFPLDPENGQPLPNPVFLSTLEDDEVPDFPTEFDRPFTTTDAALIKTAAAENLVPWLRRELEHAKRPGCAKVKRELGIRSTCDGCAHSILCGSFMCERCGRELCFDCAEMLDAVETFEPLAPGEERTLLYPPPKEGAPILEAAQNLSPNTSSKLRLCIRMKHAYHNPIHFTPLTRMDAHELERVVGEMEAWRKEHPAPEQEPGEAWLASEDGRKWLDSHRIEVPEPENSHRVLHIPGALVPPRLDDKVLVEAFEGQAESKMEVDEDDWAALELVKEEDAAASAEEVERLTAAASSSSVNTPSGVVPASSPLTLPPHLTLTPPSSFPSSTTPELTLFRTLWSLGEPFVVDLRASPPSGWPDLPWTPAYFAEQYGEESVVVSSNRPRPRAPPQPEPEEDADGDPIEGKKKEEQRRNKDGKERRLEKEAREREREKEEGMRRTTVGEFFETFGVPREVRGMGISEKIKDWPSATDFRNQYPALWHDFMQSLPAGSVTRRDGVLNISSHSPLNSNPPDLGPKGYFSQISDDREGGWGSTKLHMDIADAVNLMLWSSLGPDGCPGVAIWDLYRAEDSEAIREFLYEKIAQRENLEGGVEEAKGKHDDPIHTQEFFLDATLRRELFEQKGVKSFRILQRPGEVVFIPAGCAHQVCNFADCIKVASDFISIENVMRCWKVTTEFREQTRTKDLWRGDVLQLKSALFWAWYSAERFDAAVAESALEHALQVQGMEDTGLKDALEDPRLKRKRVLLMTICGTVIVGIIVLAVLGCKGML
ncbi:hypothetical protein JCM10213v2_008302 [Rhodosporidiobolus nylandii]